MSAPERIWAGQDRGSNWSYGWWTLIGPDDLNRTRAYILATPEALAASPEGQALIAAAETRSWNAAIEAGVVALQAETGFDDDHPAVCELRALKKGE